MKEKIRNWIINRQFIRVVCLVSICFALVSVIMFSYQIQRFKVAEVSTYYQTYASKYASSKAKLKDNNVFSESYDSEGYYQNDSLVVSFLDDVKVLFYNSLHLGTKNQEMRITKTITSYLIVDVDGEQIIQKQQDRVQQRHDYSEISSITANCDYEFVYQNYLDQFTLINNSMTGVSCAGRIEVEYKISATGTVNEQNYTYNDTMKYVLPIKSSGMIKSEYIYSSRTDIKKAETTYYNDVNYFVFSLSILFMAVAIFGCSLFIANRIYISQERRKTKFINKKLSDYDDIIVCLMSKPKVDQKKVLKVKYFDDMVKAETETSTPISFFKEGNDYHFYVFDENKTYYFHLNDLDETEEPEETQEKYE